MELVGFTANRATTGWPVEMPPRMPPAWLEANCTTPSCHAHLVGIFLAGQAAAANPSPISTPLTALMLISAAAISASSLP